MGARDGVVQVVAAPVATPQNAVAEPTPALIPVTVTCCARADPRKRRTDVPLPSARPTSPQPVVAAVQSTNRRRVGGASRDQVAQPLRRRPSKSALRRWRRPNRMPVCLVRQSNGRLCIAAQTVDSRTASGSEADPGRRKMDDLCLSKCGCVGPVAAERRRSDAARGSFRRWCVIRLNRSTTKDVGAWHAGRYIYARRERAVERLVSFWVYQIPARLLEGRGRPAWSWWRGSLTAAARRL